MLSHKEKVWVVIPAAGIGSRMQSDTPKQYLEIGGKTILEHSINRFLQHSAIHKVIVAIHPKDNHWSKLKIANNPKVVTVTGGKERADSVQNGLQEILKLGGHKDWVMVHDAARPCLESQHIDDLLKAKATSPDGAILAIPSVDTVKVSNPQQSIEKTIPRETIWLAQTPQFFEVEPLADAIVKSFDKGLSITDEASAMENLGYHPSLVIGSRKNIKITEPEDMLLASIWL